MMWLYGKIIRGEGGRGVSGDWKKGEQIITIRLKSDAIFGNSLQKVVTELTPLLESKTIAKGRK